MYNVRFFPNKNRNYFKPYGHILLIFFFHFYFHFYLTLKWKQIIIPILHSYIHQRITKFIPIQGEYE